MPLLPCDIKTFLAPFKLLANKHALSPMYKSLELSENMVRGCSNFGMLEVTMNLGIEGTMYVDASTFLAIIDSIPQDQELILADDNGVLLWACGSAKGKLALAVIENMPTIARRNKPDAWTTPAELADILELGALSCDSNTLASVGMHGVVLDNRGGALAVRTSDNITIASAELPGVSIPKAPDMVTMAPEAAALLAKVIRPGGKLEIDDTSIYYRDDGCRLVLKQVAALKHDLAEVLGNFSEAELVAPVPRDRIMAFIKRVGALTESRKSLYVELHAQAGQLALSFAEAQAGSDEYYLIEGLKLPAELSIKLDAGRLARALASIDEVVLDHVGKGAVVFHGKKPEFTYMVAGRA